MSSFAPSMLQAFGTQPRYEDGLPDFGGYFDTLGANPLEAINPFPLRYEVSMEAIAREMDLCPPGTLPPREEQTWSGPVLPLLPPYRDYYSPALRTISDDDQIPPEMQQVLDDYAHYTHTWTPNFDGMVSTGKEHNKEPILPSGPSGPFDLSVATGSPYVEATKGAYAGMYIKLPKPLPPLGRITRSMTKSMTEKDLKEKKKKTRSSSQMKEIRSLVQVQKNRSKDDHIVRCFCPKCNAQIQDTAASRGRHNRYHCPFGDKFVPTCPDCHEPYARLDAVRRHQREAASTCLETQRTKGLLPHDDSE